MTQVTRLAFAGCAVLSLAACGSQSQEKSSEQAANQLDQAADQSDPAAAKVMKERAEQIRGSGTGAALDDPNAAVQDTMREAGAAQTGAAGK
ncbi:hypothetical protein [Novosphingobium sp. 9U]|uniref:hypothetical protein n=1 Tax=Novosphingobium sp. 9U TaxID=2653158 RepID=UPI00135C07AE|nr:hypothetical protein [Novosphingobium sp. 9U]